MTSTTTDHQEPDLLTPGEANEGRLDPVRTLGGHRRYRAAEVDALLEARP